MEERNHLLQQTNPLLLRWRVNETGDKDALREKVFGCWNSYTWNQYYDSVRKTGLGLRKIGFHKGD